MGGNGKVRVGIIGSQFQADIHACAFKIAPEEAEVVAVASPSPARERRRFGQEVRYRSRLHRLSDDVRGKRHRNGHHRRPQPSARANRNDSARKGKHIVCENRWR